ncbi:coiled-coil domain-containing protein 125 isoform X3 [Scophthalmus maximus]|uniref:coiled-coil domain-containing protein 125 isoform X3 n=1 Tax=Scophthalmus maximus TaxID=52904 RepID=UPI001FA8D66A|nr:coiled-coil domain-containing protein 125 isoform X3 [Scophthalmus maximus]
MQKISEAFILDDDMVDGDLGDGKDIRAARRSTGKKSQSFGRLSEVLLPRAELLRRSSQAGETAWILGQKTAKTHPGAGWRVSRCGSLDDPSKDELKGRLQEASEVIDVLCSELDVAHRYLEGKYQALKILEGKEVNSLQWELSFSQVQMKKSEQSWEQKYNGILSENKTLTDDLQERESEVQLLRAENTAVSRQCLELLSMLNVREQRVYLGTRPQYSPERDASVLEESMKACFLSVQLAVLGACRCVGAAEACPCSRTAATSRKQLVQLQQELDAQRSRREEALMVADAFRIAFEQQLRKRSDHFLLQAETNILKSNHCKAEGVNRSPLMSVSQRLRRLLPSSVELETPDDLLESLYRLLDLLNDKDEALAHQRKVSLMLAHSADELQRQLHLDSPCQASDPSESSVPSQQPRDPSRDQSRSQQRAESPESNRREEQQVATKDEKCVLSH